MPSDSIKRVVQQVTERLAETRRELREQEQTLARLKYEWGIAKRLRSQARSEDEREKWRVQSDACMGLVLQQESVIKEIKETINQHQARLAELDAQLSSEARE
jgi:RNA processing factor Prp31